MRVAAFALFASLGMVASGHALAGKSFAGNVGAAVPSAPASAPARPSHGHYPHRGFVGGGVGFGYPWGWWYPPPYYYYYPVPFESVTYIEQADTAAPEAERWWYYCESSTSYYPYVRECPAGWERVPPR
jgi:hypothetical protein